MIDGDWERDWEWERSFKGEGEKIQERISQMKKMRFKNNIQN